MVDHRSFTNEGGEILETEFFDATAQAWARALSSFQVSLGVFVIYFSVRKAYLLSPRTTPPFPKPSPSHASPLLNHSNWTIGVLTSSTRSLPGLRTAHLLARSYSSQFIKNVPSGFLYTQKWRHRGVGEPSPQHPAMRLL